MTPGAGPLRFSVIVSSWGRPLWLKRCLQALAQLDYPAFEIVVVADAASLAQIDHEHLKTAEFDRQNISQARNLGISLAGGEICAFIDDDAVPEPTWLTYLAEAFEVTGAAAVAGYVRGRNGISYQTKVSSVDREAETHNEPDAGADPVVPILASERALKLVGTNMAVRRSVFSKIGGFDPNFRYFLEDTDFSIRVSDADLSLGITSKAQVHHAFAPSLRRSKLRTPLSLVEIGRSSALFLRRYCPEKLDEIHDRIVARERTRLHRHLVLGTCEPRDIARLLKTLEAGWAEGLDIPLSQPVAVGEGSEFKQFPTAFVGNAVRSSRFLLNRRSALKSAIEIAKSGQRVSLFSFSLTPFRHHVSYSSGVWLQTGGQFGRSDRNQPFFKWCTFARRTKDESRRVAIYRGFREK